MEEKQYSYHDPILILLLIYNRQLIAYKDCAADDFFFFGDYDNS